jgi:hypothetical protein
MLRMSSNTKKGDNDAAWIQSVALKLLELRNADVIRKTNDPRFGEDASPIRPAEEPDSDSDDDDGES